MPEKMKYFEVIERLEKALPTTNEIDYTKISPEELWQRVINFLNETQITFSKDVLTQLELTVKEFGHLVYTKYTNLGQITSPSETKGFDQNNYFIKDNLNHIKTQLMKEIYNYSNISFSDRYFKNEYGEEKVVRQHIDKEAIKKYITNIFIVTAEKDDTINLNYSSEIAEQIFLYFGFELPDKYSYDEELEQISNLISNVFYSSKVYNGEPKMGDFGYEYESSSTDMNKFSAEAQSAIEKIVRYVIRRSNKMLEEGIKENEKYDEYQKNRTPKPTIETIEPPQSNSSVEEQELYEIMNSYDEMIMLIEENKRIAQQIAKLEEEREKLKAELEENNAKITEKMSRGIK